MSSIVESFLKNIENKFVGKNVRAQIMAMVSLDNYCLRLDLILPAEVIRKGKEQVLSFVCENLVSEEHKKLLRADLLEKVEGLGKENAKLQHENEILVNHLNQAHERIFKLSDRLIEKSQSKKKKK